MGFTLHRGFESRPLRFRRRARAPGSDWTGGKTAAFRSCESLLTADRTPVFRTEQSALKRLLCRSQLLTSPPQLSFAWERELRPAVLVDPAFKVLCDIAA